MKPYIYKKTLIPTKKSYIGKHNGKNKYYQGSGKEWMKDIKKYGKQHIITEILEIVDDISKINEREEWWLKKYDAANNPEFYNMTNNSFGLSQQSDSTKKIKSELLKNRIITWGNKIGESNKGKTKGIRKHSDESKNKISKGLKNNPSLKNNLERSKKISISLGMNTERNKKISEKLKGKPKSDVHITNMKKPKPEGFNNNMEKQIIQMTNEGKYLNTYKSITQASKETGYSISGISNCLRKKSKSAYGYKWEYHEKQIWNGWNDI